MNASEQIQWNLTNHAVDGYQAARIERIRSAAKELGAWIYANAPESRERSLALTNLEQATMWAVAAIAREQ